jgi:hypothetical protein
MISEWINNNLLEVAALLNKGGVYAGQGGSVYTS